MQKNTSDITSRQLLLLFLSVIGRFGCRKPNIRFIFWILSAYRVSKSSLSFEFASRSFFNSVFLSLRFALGFGHKWRFIEGSWIQWRWTNQGFSWKKNHQSLHRFLLQRREQLPARSRYLRRIRSDFHQPSFSPKIINQFLFLAASKHLALRAAWKSVVCSELNQPSLQFTRFRRSSQFYSC